MPSSEAASAIHVGATAPAQPVTVRALLGQATIPILRKRLQRHLGGLGVSFVASNCAGSRLSILMEEPFRSPTVNLWLGPDDYLTFVGTLEAYRDRGGFRPDPEETRRIGYPVGVLGGPGLADVRVYFQHFASVSDGAEAWSRRFARLDLARTVLVLSQSPEFTEAHLRAFDALPYPKIAFARRPYPSIPSAAWVPGLHPGEGVGDLFGNWWRLVFALTDRRLAALRKAVLAASKR